MRRGRNRLVRSAWVGCLGIAVALAGCGSAPSTSTARATQHGTPTTTASPSAGTTHPWQQVALPAGHTLDNSGLGVSPLDGSTAWFCAPTTAAGTFAVWSTHDTGVTWQQISTITPAGPAGPWGCGLTIDARDPHTLAVMFSSGAGADGSLRTISYLSSDGGTRWTRVPGLVGIGQLESISGTRYAVLNDTTDPAQESQLVVSADGLQSWRVLRPASLATPEAFFRFWLDSSGQQLFAATYNGGLWQTPDTGATWRQLPLPAPPAGTPPIQIGLGAWLPQQSQWDFCGWSAQPRIVWCSTNLGASWPAKPSLDTATSCANCAQDVPPPDHQNCYPNALEADGSILAVCLTAGSTQNAPSFGVYRLPFGAAAWQRLTLAPALLLAAPATGAVWYSGQSGVFTAALPS